MLDSLTGGRADVEPESDVGNGLLRSPFNAQNGVTSRHKSHDQGWPASRPRVVF